MLTIADSSQSTSAGIGFVLIALIALGLSRQPATSSRPRWMPAAYAAACLAIGAGFIVGITALWLLGAVGILALIAAGLYLRR